MKFLIIKTKVSTRDDLLKAISKKALLQKITSSEKALFEGFLKREKQGTTGFADGIAIPHARVDEINTSAIIIARNEQGIDWPALDKKPTDLAISLIIENTENVGKEHMKYLSAISSLLIDPKNQKVFREGTLAQVQKLVQDKVDAKKAPAKKVDAKPAPAKKDEPKAKPKGLKGKYRVVCISTCPTGVAHTNMAAESLLREGKRRNLSIKVERQAAEGIVDGLTAEDIAGAEVVIIAAGKKVDGMERFAGKRLLEVKVVEPIRDAGKVIDDAFANLKIYKAARGDTLKQAASIDGGATPLQALLNGVSYMIPFVVVGGILLAMSIGLGGEKTPDGLVPPSHSFWLSIKQIGNSGFALMIPILGGFIGSAIGGRAAITPSMIVSYLVGNGTTVDKSGNDVEFWNYQDGHFGGFEHPAKLGFLGAIAAGFLIGYLVRYYRMYISSRMPKALKPVDPIIFIPLSMSFIGWFVFAFAGYLPLYYLSLGLNESITWLNDNNLFFIAALILGAMIAFDMGGPVNKIAFLFAGGMIASNATPMGAVAAAIAVPPLGCGLGMLIGKYIFRLKCFNDEDQANSYSALFMSLVGITEGAIPFAVKFPKQVIIANVLGGAIGAGFVALFHITDGAQHGGFIVYILGAIGKNSATAYGFGLLYILGIIVGGLTTATVMIVGLKFFNKGQATTAKVPKAIQKRAAKIKAKEQAAQAQSITK